MATSLPTYGQAVPRTLNVDSPNTKIDLVKISWQARTTKPRFRNDRGRKVMLATVAGAGCLVLDLESRLADERGR